MELLQEMEAYEQGFHLAACNNLCQANISNFGYDARLVQEDVAGLHIKDDHLRMVQSTKCELPPCRSCGFETPASCNLYLHISGQLSDEYCCIMHFD